MDQEALGRAIDQEAMIQGAIHGSGSNGSIDWFWSDRPGSNRRSDAWLQAMGQGSIEGTMNGSDSNRRSDGSVSNRRSDGSERNNRSNGSGTNRRSDGSGSNRRNDEYYKQSIGEQAMDQGVIEWAMDVTNGEIEGSGSKLWIGRSINYVALIFISKNVTMER